MTMVTWLGCDLVSGQIVEELPDLRPQGELSALLGSYTSAAFTLPIPIGGHGAAPKNWEGATQPGRCMLVAVLGGAPVWAGIVLNRAGGTEATVDLSTVSLEGYLDRRYVADHQFTGVDEALIAAAVVGDANLEGIGFTVDAPATGTLRDRSYFDKDDKTVYSVLRELMGVIDGPEFTVTLDWTNTTQTAIRKTITVRKRIGHASSIPNAVFTTGDANAVLSTIGASDARYTFQEDYTAGKGANHVVAVSSGEGDVRPQSAPARDAALFAIGWPRWEYRFTPSTSITDTDVLNDHAAAALAIQSRGARSITISARADVYPQLGVDWFIGDDIGYDLIGHRHPAGLQGVARAVGWTLDPTAGIVSPMLLTPGEDLIS